MAIGDRFVGVPYDFERYLAVAPARRRGYAARGHEMRYHDGQPIHVGDVVTIDVRHQGIVVGCIEDGVYLHPHTQEQWTHLRQGVLIDTSFCGVLHYPDQTALEADEVQLLRRQA